MTKKIIIMISIVSMLASTAQAEVPNLLNYQGRLTDPVGDTVPNGNYSVTFRIYDDSLAGSILWEEGGLVTVQRGLFGTLLGSITPITPSLFSQPDRWLGVQVGLDPEIAPRARLISVPFAQHAQTADTASTSLDKTIDAGELSVGVLDTARYSAYLDLQSESRIGTGTMELSAGDHTHSNPTGGLTTLSDTSFYEELVPANDSILAKEIVIPASTYGGMVRVTSYGGNGPVNMTIYVNGVRVVPETHNLVVMHLIKAAGIADTLRWQTTISYFLTDFITPGPDLSVDVNSDLIIQVWAKNVSGSVNYGRIGTVIVEYGP